MTKAFNIRQVVKVLGTLLIIEGMAMLLTAGVSALYRDSDMQAFLVSAGITLGVGLTGVLVGRGSKRQFGTREGYLIVGMVWILFSFFGMLPFMLSGTTTSAADAFFETMSGFTTTGATIFTDIDALPHGILFWRCLSHWLGGMGIVVLSMALLPLFGVGMQVYQAEAPGLQHDKLLPRLKDTARRLWEIYIALTIILTLLLRWFGMDLFDAVCHAFSTLATGGFSTKQASVAFWPQPIIQYTLTVFMFVAGINYTLLYNAVAKQQVGRLFRDDEFKTYSIIVIVATIIITALLVIHGENTTPTSVEYDFRRAVFQVVSIVTSTGFATDDFILWSPISIIVILFLMFVGASAGSTTGGIKVVRLTITVKNAYNELRRIIHPKAIVPVRLNRHVVPESVVAGVFSFLSIYVTIIIISTVVMLLCGMNITESVGAALSMISNIGPGLGEQGPAGSFANVTPFVKWYLSILMLIGRLEIFTILLLFSPSFWKK